MASRFCDAPMAGVPLRAAGPLTVTTITAYSLENICCLSGNNRESTLTPPRAAVRDSPSFRSHPGCHSFKESNVDASVINIAIVVVYLLAMLAFGWWGKSRTRNNSDFLVAGRRLGPFLYTGTMAAVVLGGASTVGGVGLGYKFGISGMWLVVAIGAGVLLLSLLFAVNIEKM
jgi:hypothetical protein